jgi:hypothetical protein
MLERGNFGLDDGERDLWVYAKYLTRYLASE